MKLSYKKLIILMLYTPNEDGCFNEPISGRTRLMKMGFLFKKEILPGFRKDKNIDEENLTPYFPWKYGPFSTDFLNDLEFLINQEFVDVTFSSKSPILEELEEYSFWIEDVEEFKLMDYDEEVFNLTEEKGIKKAESLWDELSENQKSLLTEFKKVLNRLSLGRILEYVYKKYEKEGLTDKSLIKERYF